MVTLILREMRGIKIKSLLYVCLLLSVSLVSVRGQRGGGGRGRNRNQKQRGGMAFQTANVDPNSKMEYYNNPSGARITKASHFDLEFILGQKIMFLCEARGDPRPQITWYKDGSELYIHPYLQLHEWKMGEHEIKSKMEIDPAAQMDAGVYECHANNKFAIDRRIFKTDYALGD